VSVHRVEGDRWPHLPWRACCDACGRTARASGADVLGLRQRLALQGWISLEVRDTRGDALPINLCPSCTGAHRRPMTATAPAEPLVSDPSGA